MGIINFHILCFKEMMCLKQKLFSSQSILVFIMSPESKTSVKTILTHLFPELKNDLQANKCVLLPLDVHIQFLSILVEYCFIQRTKYIVIHLSSVSLLCMPWSFTFKSFPGFWGSVMCTFQHWALWRSQWQLNETGILEWSVLRWGVYRVKKQIFYKSLFSLRAAAHQVRFIIWSKRGSLLIISF